MDDPLVFSQRAFCEAAIRARTLGDRLPLPPPESAAQERDQRLHVHGLGASVSEEPDSAFNGRILPSISVSKAED